MFPLKKLWKKYLTLYENKVIPLWIFLFLYLRRLCVCLPFLFFCSPRPYMDFYICLRLIWKHREKLFSYTVKYFFHNFFKVNNNIKKKRKKLWQNPFKCLEKNLFRILLKIDFPRSPASAVSLERLTVNLSKLITLKMRKRG